MVKRKHSNDNYQITVTNKKRKTDINNDSYVLKAVENTVLLDKFKKPWRIGEPIGKGGFGELFLASDIVSRPVTTSNAEYVVKFEPHLSGPLFVEIHCLISTARLLDGVALPLGMPQYIASGTHYIGGEQYRFLILHRYVCDLNSLIQGDCRVHSKHTLIIACQIIDILEYFHDKGYVHCDIKPENLMIGRCSPPGTELSEERIFLIDFGLASKYIERSGKHRPFRLNQRRTHVGTIEFASRDAHIGTHYRRSDLECLGYNLIFLCEGTLPWIDDKLFLKPKRIHDMKEYFMTNIELVLRQVYGPNVPQFLADFMLYVGNLAYDQRPDYGLCKYIFEKAFTSYGYNLKTDMILNVADLKQNITVMNPDNVSNKKHFKLSGMLSVAKSNILDGNCKNSQVQIVRQYSEKDLECDAAQQRPVSHKYTGNPTYAILQMEQKIRSKYRLLAEKQSVDINRTLIAKGYTKSMLQIIKERQIRCTKLETIQEQSQSTIEICDSSSSEDG